MNEQSSQVSYHSMKAMPQNVIQPCSRKNMFSYSVQNKLTQTNLHNFSGPLRSFGSIYCTKTKIFGDLADVVQTNRGALQNYQHISFLQQNYQHIICAVQELHWGHLPFADGQMHSIFSIKWRLCSEAATVKTARCRSLQWGALESSSIACHVNIQQF